MSVENTVDLSRDVLKSDTCSMYCEELDLEGMTALFFSITFFALTKLFLVIVVQCGTLGSRFTTMEGILSEIRDQLSSTIFDIEDTTHRGGDSMPASEKEKWDRFFARLEKAIKGEHKFVITLVDPLANSYVQDLCAPAPDPQLAVEEYTRTKEEEDDLGWKDMKTEGYEEDAQEVQKAQGDENDDEDKQKASSAMDDLLDASMSR